MEFKALICMVFISMVSGDMFDIKPCLTRDSQPGSCFYSRFCHEYWLFPKKQRSSFQNTEACGFEMVCCPMYSRTHFHPPSEPYGFEIGASQTETSRVPHFLKPTNSPRILKKSSTTVRTIIPSSQKPVVVTDNAAGGSVSNIDTTPGFVSSGEIVNPQILFPNNCSTVFLETRIFGGTETQIGEFPWMALLEYDYHNESRMVCGGSLITNLHVLTAAHCAHEQILKASNLTLRSVRLGEWDITTDPDCIKPSASLRNRQKPKCFPKILTIPIQKIIIHPQYEVEASAAKHDIAILELQEYIQFNNFVKPICLPENDKSTTLATVAGWGRAENGLPSRQLLKVDVPLANRQECESNYREKNVSLISSQLCYGVKGKDSCAGDSGGPLMQMNESGNGQFSVRMIGIVSAGPPRCGLTDTPGIYTKVYDYVPWIRNQIRSTNERVAKFRSDQTPKSYADDSNTKCYTRDDAKGVCLRTRDCPEYLATRGRERRIFRKIEGCPPFHICCPVSPNSHSSQEPETKNRTLFTDHKLNTDNDTTQVSSPKPQLIPLPNVKWNNSKLILPSNCRANLYDIRIMGGSETDVGEVPWMALLEYESGNELEFKCGGSLISNWHVLTAAHCSDKELLEKYGITLRSVRLGEWDTSLDPDCFVEIESPLKSPKLQCAPKILRIPIEKVFFPPLYKTNSTSRYHDIALLQLKEPVQFNNFVRPICLPINEDITPWATVVGWGRTETSVRSDKLLKVDLPLVDRHQCELTYNKINVPLISSQLCFGGEKNRDSCDGDSGGPLFQTDYSGGVDSSRVQIVGVVSMGPRDCGIQGLTGIYTKVYDYVPWMYEQFRLMDIS
ncbi:hypothetical protein QAD02_011972 [Eretmocerus hayati]|uniref:Uncharacterized protein n=1 Tax=Eretmocerus hayati TaxID=131215 RepID=A0ACC2NZF5_9HYME|nr:hypothetical protein QAD02_011972 [Eretmocerus hayati]